MEGIGITRCHSVEPRVVPGFDDTPFIEDFVISFHFPRVQEAWGRDGAPCCCHELYACASEDECYWDI